MAGIGDSVVSPAQKPGFGVRFLIPTSQLCYKLWNVNLGRTPMEIGQKVKVRRLRDRVSAATVNKLKQNPVGTVAGYKPLDGQEVGIVVKFDDQFATWFFEDELEPIS
nr:DUF2862 domain-containing protein [Desertifilum tharense]